MLIQNMNAKNLQSILKTMDFVPVEVYLPKFKFSFQSSYADILQDVNKFNNNYFKFNNSFKSNFSMV